MQCHVNFCFDCKARSKKFSASTEASFNHKFSDLRKNIKLLLHTQFTEYLIWESELLLPLGSVCNTGHQHISLGYVKCIDILILYTYCWWRKFHICEMDIRLHFSCLFVTLLCYLLKVLFLEMPSVHFPYWRQNWVTFSLGNLIKKCRFPLLSLYTFSILALVEQHIQHL